MKKYFSIIIVVTLFSCSRNWDNPFDSDNNIDHQPPTVTTNAADNISLTTATLNGEVNANGQSTTVTFEYGTTTSYGSTVAATPKTVTDSSNTMVSANIGGLTENTDYHFRVKAVSTAGNSYGSDQAFTSTYSGLIAYYPFNGNANDESGNGNDGVVFGAALSADRFGVANSAYSFDGINDYIDIGNNVKPDFPMSVSAWVYNTDINPGSFGTGTIFRNDFWDHTSSYYGVNIQNSSGYLLAGIGNGGIAAPWSRFGVVTNDVVFSENDWFNVVAVFISPQTMNLYVNGEEAEASSGSGTASSRAYSGANGAIGFSRDQPFAGKIDDVRIYNRALNESEIQELYHEGGWGN